MERQTQVHRQILRFLENFKKVGRNNYTPAMTRSRIRTLKELWLQFTDGHTVLERTIPEANWANIPYFSEAVYDSTEDVYLSTLDHLAEVLEELEPPVSPNQSVEHSYSRASPNSMALSHLPAIQLPSFDGNVVDWEQFRDRFKALLIDNKDLSDFARMHYLISSLRGRALECLSGLSITADNFSIAWQTLGDRFENKRRLLSVHMSTLLSLPHLSRESATDLQALRSKAKVAVASLYNLPRTPAELWDNFLVHIVAQGLDPLTRRAWTLRSPDGTEPLSFATFDRFLADRIRALEEMSRSPPGRVPSKPTGVSRVHSTVASTAPRSACPVCSEGHFFSACRIFLTGNPSQRRELVRKHRRCYNCLSQNHSANKCTSKYTCRKCHLRHYSLLHDASDSQSSISQSDSAPTATHNDGGAKSDAHSLLAVTGALRRAPVLLATARVKVTSSCGRSAHVRALIDQGSEITLVSERISQLLRASRFRMPVSICAVGGVAAGTFRHAITLQVSPLSSSSPTLSTTAVILKRLTTYSPRDTIDRSDLRHLTGIPWADPEPLSGEPIELILGADLYGDLLCDGVLKGSVGQPIAQETIFGWILSGPIRNPELGGSSSCARVAHHPRTEEISVSHCLASINEELQRFWEIEEVPSASLFSPDDERCETFFKATHSRLPDGRYCVRLPFKREPPIAIGSSRVRAERSFASLSRRLEKSSSQRKDYCEFLREYEGLGHMRRAVDSDRTRDVKVYLPHHPAFRAHSSTTSLRVVFNASSLTSNGTSLNDHLLAGPKLQTDLPAVILRWRNFQFVYCADIEKMYRQIRVDERDVDFQRILWSESLSSEPTEYQLTTVTYGTVCAPFLALRVLHQLILDEGRDFPLATPLLRENIYVDDILFGGDTIESLTQTRDQLISILQRGGFHLRKWAANSPALLADLTGENSGLACSKNLDFGESIKVLGITWVPSEDVFRIRVSLPELLPQSKRNILSTIARLFDPLGWATPVIISTKILLQSLWRRNLNWDDPIPDDLLSRWKTMFKELASLDGMRVCRWTGFDRDIQHLELHGFADASNAAYAAVVYCKVISRANVVTISLLTAKSKVAPLKVLSIPRLELSAAVILARLIEFVRSSLAFNQISCYCWSDFTVVLSWLSQHPSKWKVFVANRVADIQARVPTAQWRHVPTNENPADCASRGLIGPELTSLSLWWKGPSWLALSEEHWPRSFPLPPDDASHEEKAVVLHCQKQTASWEFLSQFSLWPKLIRVLAYIMRFISACRRDTTACPDSDSRSLALTAAECALARTVILKHVQSQLFATEIKSLNNQTSLPAHNSILPLSPFLDRDGLLRVGGRISRAPLPFDRKHPILLASHAVTDRIIDHAHLRALHAGLQLTLNVVRETFWIVRARSLVRFRISRCVVCARERAAVATQLMSDLPRFRVSAPSRSFQHCGIDYAGPLQVRASSGRGIASRKAYIAVFICLASRAIHLELVADYSSQSFLNAFSRFSARRGLPQSIYSDNGTNFVGGDRELRAAYQAALRDPDFQNRTATDRIEWKFLPPAAPHFGGIWEAGVKSVKHHLRRILKDHTLTFEETATLLCRIEACLNSRPIAPLSDTFDNHEPLTPGHFLVGSAITSYPEPSLLDVKENRLTRWQLVRQMTERFWRLWYSDYVNSLQQRSKWRKIQPSLRSGQLVLIKNTNLPPCKWELGRITRCHPGADGLIRVVTVRTASSELTRPIAKLCVLPVDCKRGENPAISERSN